MYRHIVFRGYDTKSRKWRYGYLTRDKDGNFLVDNFLVDEQSLGQFTGIYDANGLGIYEHDIVSLIVYEKLNGDVLTERPVYKRNSNTLVKYGNGEFYLCYFYRPHSSEIGEEYLCRLSELYFEEKTKTIVKVIGNLQRYPHLMQIIE